MADEIINRVSNSILKTIDLEDFYPTGTRVQLDIQQWLFKGLILKEKEFRVALQNYDWSQYQNAYVALYCSADAILPGWAYLLVTTYLNPITKKTIIGDLIQLETILYLKIIEGLDITEFINKPVIIKGCASKPVPEAAYVALLQKLQPISKSIMYGEACSSVPLFKRK